MPQGKVQLRVKRRQRHISFEYATDGKNFKEMGRMNACYISTETPGGFTEITLGLYALPARLDQRRTQILNISTTRNKHITRSSEIELINNSSI